MQRFARQLVCLVALILILVAPTLPHRADAMQDVATPIVAPSVTTTVDFVEDAALTIDFDELVARGDRAGTATVTLFVQNTSPDSINGLAAHLLLDGLPDQNALAPRLTIAPGSIAPGAVAAISLSLDTHTRPTAGEYPGVILVISPTTSPVTRAVQLIVSEATPRVLPAGVDAVAADTTNAVPSLLSRSADGGWALLLYLAAIMLVVVGVLAVIQLIVRPGRIGTVGPLWRRIDALPRFTLVGIGLGVAVVVFVVALGLNMSDVEPRMPAFSRVASVHVPATPLASPGEIGQLHGSNGGQAVVSLTTDGLTVAGFPRAGDYGGTIDPDGNGPVAAILFTIDVRDAWLWAVLTIAAGVIVGYSLERHLKVDAPANDLAVGIARVWRDTIARPWAGSLISGVQQIASRLNRAWQEQEDGGAKGSTLLQDATTYRDQLDILSYELDILGATTQRIDSALGEPVRKEAPILVAVKRLRADAGALDQTGPTVESIKELAARARTLDVWGDEFLRTLAQIESHIAMIDTHLKSIATSSGRNAAALGELKQELVRTSERVIGAPDVAAIKLLRVTADNLFERAQKLFPTGSVRSNDKRQGLAGLNAGGSGTSNDPSTDAIACMIAIEYLRPAIGVRPGVNPDDLVLITATLTSHRMFTLHDPHWHIDGIRTPVGPYVPEQDDGFRIVLQKTQRFGPGGPYTIRLEAPGIGGPGASTTTARFGDRGLVEELVDARRVSASQATVVTGALAILSGFVLLYFESDTWGSQLDYLNAFLWGAVVSEGLRLVGSLGQKMSSIVGKSVPGA